MRVRAVAIAGLCAAVLCPPAPSHADGGTLTVTGTRNAYAWLTVKRTVRYNLDTARVNIGDGQYGGFAIDGDAATLHTVYNPRGDATFVGHSITAGVLKPGRYKVRLFADGHQVTASIPWSGPSTTLTARSPIDARVQVAEALAPDIDGTVALTLPQDGRRKGVNTSLMVSYESVVGQYFMIRGCVSRIESTCRGTSFPWLVEQEVGGMGLNGMTVKLHNYNSGPTAGMYARGEIVGTTVGMLTVLTLRYYA